MEVEFFKEGMEAVWADVQKRAGEFKDVPDTDIMKYFMERFGVSKSELSKRCIFLKEKATGKYIGTCMAWFEPKGKHNVSVVHWLAVDDAYAGKGYARMLITQVLKFLKNLGKRAAFIYILSPVRIGQSNCIAILVFVCARRTPMELL